MILMIDNYDSFTWNVVQYLWELGAEVEVHRNDEITLADIAQKAPAGLCISPVRVLLRKPVSPVCYH
ncbi:MAG: hypothetical protein CM15mP89_4240 [Gammaproteobacteria bacterium]|nr:MAG: hypothetical protein CM15mP89_4240 [Gammaproteobacteria bacterium]